MLWASYDIARGLTIQQVELKSEFLEGNAMRRFAAIGVVAVVGALAIPVAAQKGAPPTLDVRALSARPEFVSGGDVLVQVSGPATLTAKNLIVLVNGKNVSAAFKPAADKALVGLVTGLNVGSNSIQASMRATGPMRSSSA